MKNLTFYILKTEDKNNANIYHNKFCNSLIKFSAGKFYFHSRYSPPVEINYIYSTVNIDIGLIKTIERIYESSLIEARKISTENMV